MAVNTETSLLPTRKWWAALATGIVSIVATWIVSGAFDGTEKGQLAALLVALVGAYFLPNEPTPGGVPTRVVNQ